MKICIYTQYLDGNSIDGFDHEAFLNALETEYRELAEHYFPDAELAIDIDRQSNCSGYCRPTSVEFIDDEDVDADAERQFDFIVQDAENRLYNDRGDEFSS